MRYHLHHCPPLLPVDGGPADVRLVVAQSQLGLPGTSEHHYMSLVWLFYMVLSNVSGNKLATVTSVSGLCTSQCWRDTCWQTASRHPPAGLGQAATWTGVSSVIQRGLNMWELSPWAPGCSPSCSWAAPACRASPPAPLHPHPPRCAQPGPGWRRGSGPRHQTQTCTWRLITIIRTSSSLPSINCRSNIESISPFSLHQGNWCYIIHPSIQAKHSLRLKDWKCLDNLCWLLTWRLPGWRPTAPAAVAAVWPSPWSSLAPDSSSRSSQLARVFPAAGGRAPSLCSGRRSGKTSTRTVQQQQPACGHWSCSQLQTDVSHIPVAFMMAPTFT